MKLVKKILAAAIAVCMVLSLTACADTTWVFNYNGKIIPSGVYLGMSVSAYSEAASKASDTEKKLLDQQIEEKPAKDWIIDRTKALCGQYIAVENKFEEMGLSLSESDNNEVDQSLKVMWEVYGPMYEENGVGQKSCRAILENNKKAALVFGKYYGTGGPEEISDDALTVHYRENFASVNIFSLSKIMPIGDEGLTDEQTKENQDLQKLGEEYVERINSGKAAFNEVKDEYKHKSDETKHDADDEEDKIQDDKESRVLIGIDSANPSEYVVTAVFDAIVGGDAVLVSDDRAHYLVKRYDVVEKPEDFEEMKISLLQDIKGEDFQKLIDEWGLALTPDANQAAVNRYSPKNIVM